MKLSSFFASSFLLIACGDDTSVVFDDVGTPDTRMADVDNDVADGNTSCAASLPIDGPRLSLTAAGAPSALFGPADSPTFRAGYQELLDAGFTRFFPFFGTREIVDRPDGDTTPSLSSGHERYFFVDGCAGGTGFSDARDVGMELLFPAFFFYVEGESAPFDEETFRSNFAAYQSTCFGDAESAITAYYNYDEMASNWVGIELVNRAFAK